MFRIRTLFAALVAMLTAMAALVAGSPLAGAQRAPDPVDDGGTLSTSITAPAHSITSPTQLGNNGEPIWTLVLVVLLTAIVTVAITLLAVQRLHRSSHQPVRADVS